jgi:hypothetical protein
MQHRCEQCNGWEQLQSLAAVHLQRCQLFRCAVHRPTLDALGSISYEASDLSGEDSSEAWVQGLAAALDAAVSRLQQLLTPKNYDALVSLVLTDVAKRAHLCSPPASIAGSLLVNQC